MTFYFIPFLLLTVLTLLESSKRINFITQNKLIYALIALFFIIFIGLRYEIGCDWEQYKEMFEKYEFITFNDIFKRNFIGEHNLQRYPELGHIFITKISQNIYILNLIYSILFLFKIKKKIFFSFNFISLLCSSSWNGSNKASSMYIFFNAFNSFNIK